MRHRDSKHANGAMQFENPHHGSSMPVGAGGCNRCVDHWGSAKHDANGLPVQRCCTSRFVTIPLEELALYQSPAYGTPEWYWQYSTMRASAEGAFGMLKSPTGLNWGRGFHNMMGVTAEALIACFTVVAANLHALARWFASGESGPIGPKRVKRERPAGRPPRQPKPPTSKSQKLAAAWSSSDPPTAR